MDTLGELATLAVVLAVILGVAVTTLVCARPRPCRYCRARHRAGNR